MAILAVPVIKTKLTLDTATYYRLLKQSRSILIQFSSVMDLLMVSAGALQKLQFYDRDEHEQEPRRSCTIIAVV